MTGAGKATGRTPFDLRPATHTMKGHHDDDRTTIRKLVKEG